MRTFTLIIAVALTLLAACGTPVAAPAGSSNTTIDESVDSNADATEVATQVVAGEITGAAVVTNSAATIPATFDRKAMLSHLVDTTILPAQQAIVDSVTALEQAIDTLSTEPTAANLEAAQAAWRTAAEAWARSEVYSLRFAMLASNQVKKWPVNTGFMEDAIAGGETLDEAFVEGSGSNAKGLAAVEYLLFDPSRTNEEIAALLENEPRRLSYLVALSQNLTRKATELFDLWSPDGDNQAQAFIEADFSDNNVQGSISMIANEAIALVELIVKEKIDNPLSGVYAQANPQAVESRRAAYSAPLIVANLRGVQQLFDGGLASYLDFLQGNDALSTAIDTQIEEAIDAVEAIDVPLQEAVLTDPDAVRKAGDTVKALLVLLKVDMANQMSITVTFSDNDGD